MAKTSTTKKKTWFCCLQSLRSSTSQNNAGRIFGVGETRPYTTPPTTIIATSLYERSIPDHRSNASTLVCSPVACRRLPHAASHSRAFNSGVFHKLRYERGANEVGIQHLGTFYSPFRATQGAAYMTPKSSQIPDHHRSTPHTEQNHLLSRASRTKTRILQRFSAGNICIYIYFVYDFSLRRLLRHIGVLRSITFRLFLRSDEAVQLRIFTQNIVCFLQPFSSTGINTPNNIVCFSQSFSHRVKTSDFVPTNRAGG